MRARLTLDPANKFLSVEVALTARRLRQLERAAQHGALEPLPALVLTAPLFVPLAAGFGVDPVHLGLVMTCNLAIGLYTPPVGGTLFVAARIGGVGVGALSRALVPLFAVSVLVLLLITYVDSLAMGPVRWLR
jgi:C4-dicarboxylate transporter DctM subunit